ncbi:MAG: 8-amino-7-oxononanoate synthase [Planctomycetota bacterium]|nr:8-amino-7-oxononanoate synthase [Planctomycetota bacterium]
MGFASKELADLAAKRLLRRMRVVSRVRGARVTIDGREHISFASNDYLGLSQNPAPRQAICDALESDGFFGAGASRLISGTTDRHVALEKALASFKEAQSALLFSSGYAANLGVVTSLADADTFIAADERNHASLIDACKLSRAQVHVYEHCDHAAASRALCNARGFRRRLLITDGVFSMDGDIAPLKELADAAKRNDAVFIVDDAHGTGVLGEHGRGSPEALGVEKNVDILVGTLSKALGCVGGFVCGAEETITLIANRARTLFYTTALPPAFCAAAITALGLVRESGELRTRLRSNVALLRGHVAHRAPVSARESQDERGRAVGDGNRRDGAGEDVTRPKKGEEQASSSPIVPVVVGDERRALEVAEGLMADGIFAPAIRPPTVPVGACRIRVSVSALHTAEDIHALVSSFRRQGVI